MKQSLLSIFAISVFSTSVMAADLENLKTKDVRKLFSEAIPANAADLDVNTARICRYYSAFDKDEHGNQEKPGYFSVTIEQSNARTGSGKPSKSGLVLQTGICGVGSSVVGSEISISSQGVTASYDGKAIDNYIAVLKDGSLIMEIGLSYGSGIQSIADSKRYAGAYLICPKSGETFVCDKL